MLDQKEAVLRLSGSTVKSWFQYRCDRKTRYETLTPDERAVIPVLQTLQPSAWAQFGMDFEKNVLNHLRTTGASIYLPLNKQATHDDLTTLPFISGARTEEYAYQLRLESTPWLERELGISANEIRILNGFPDLVRMWKEDGIPVFELTDIKATHVATPFHKTQVAFYSLMLEGILNRLNLAGRISETAYIWRLKDEGGELSGEIEESPFTLSSYTELVKDFFRRKVQSLRKVEVGPGRDDICGYLSATRSLAKSISQESRSS